MLHISVEREIKREHWIEGFDAYHAFVLGPACVAPSPGPPPLLTDDPQEEEEDGHHQGEGCET